MVQYGISERATVEPIGTPMLRMNNLQANGWDLKDLKYIQLDTETEAQFLVKKGDILFNRTNSKELVGKCEVFNEDGSWVFASYLIRVRLNESEALPNFVSEFLNTNAGRVQINRVSRQIIGMSNVNAEELRDLLIPLPPLDIQRALVAEMEAARESRRAKLNEAETLLKSLDGWLLIQLGITIPPKSKHKVFAARLGEARGRVDAAFHSPRFRAIREGLEHGNYPARTVRSFCISIKSGFAAGKQDQAENIEDGVPHLRPLNLSIYGDLSLKGTKYVPRTSLAAHDICEQGEVLFNNTNSEELVGKSTVFDLDIDCACSNHMTRLKLTPDASPYFIAVLFNALRSTGYLGMLATNFVNQAGINAETLATLRIPFPALDIQQTFLLEVSQRRAEARRLRAEAETEWQAAKERFEDQLLAGK
ncbi:MAG TPA: restriction endonuclease subunit S [Pyrinomonadaceae bacterium]|nr:restriction endonuclease subunit S [Pyrinomonadaceae bacterium]